jgi:hypothetical protein
MTLILNNIRAVKFLCFTLILSLSTNIDAQDQCEIKNFNQSFTFNNTFQVDAKNNNSTETSSGIFIAKFTIDKNGAGSIDFKTEVVYLDEISKEPKKTANSTIVIVNKSEITKVEGRNTIYLAFHCTRINGPRGILITLEINSESNRIQKFYIFDESNEKMFFFY